ncbi:hypothetical protein [Limnoglobus roseus]|uniref:Uncharacterized protein n=1 Tax=Limnoglobus roseus TaxID=2598579 RepID=A0A5C1A697_9BACT|nr:hypothetical protein [Limnoglobus roseus]QEL13362.1 hypothetical protein PX52LOC_00216 [Limnoglobus roseus]
MSVHAIRLRGFWTAAEVEPGRVRYARNFGRPRTLDAGETVWLVGSRSPGAGQVLLNWQPVGAIHADEPFAFEITSILQPRNTVEIEIAAGEDKLLGEIALEIRSSD